MRKFGPESKSNVEDLPKRNGRSEVEGDRMHDAEADLTIDKRYRKSAGADAGAADSDGGLRAETRAGEPEAEAVNNDPVSRAGGPDQRPQPPTGQGGSSGKGS